MSLCFRWPRFDTARRRLSLPIVARFALVMGLLLGGTPGYTAQNWNPSFEQVEADRPVGWKPFTWAGRAEFRLASSGHEGRRSVQVVSERGADAAWTAIVPVQPFATYRLTAWIKTENVEKGSGAGALINLHARPERTPALTGSQDWTRVEMTLETGRDDTLQVNCILGYFGQAKGKAWFDDLRLELVQARTLQPQITLRGTPARDPISPYIYSQFIEHLGRCIYGGIWAEMLEDRKYYAPVGSRESPWKPLGATRVTMDTRQPFVGDHTPTLTLTGKPEGEGIGQGGLSLQQGKGYVGRIWLAGDSLAAPVQVRLIWGDGPNDRQTVPIRRLSPAFTKTTLRFTAGATVSKGRLEIVAQGRGTLRIGPASLMPADNIRGMRADTLRVLRDLNAPLYRWPGGNFVSGYDWRDGLGDPDRRPPRKNPAWLGVEHNDFGLHEFLDFCQEVKTEPLIVANTGFGDAHSAAQEVEYVNGATNTPMGSWRTRNGQRTPWNVVWWGVGNEMWGPWQLGYMALNQYVLKHNEVERKMRQVDPRIKTVASGDLGGGWSEGMLRHCANQMTLLSEHFYCQERPSVSGHVAQMTEAIRAKAVAHREYRKTLPALRGKDIRIAMDEWNYWYGPHLYGELGTRYFLKDALGVAAGLHEFYRNTDIIFMANYAQTVNVIGCVKTTPTAAALETTGLILQLYRAHYGVFPLPLTGAPEPLDVAAALSQDRKTLTVGVVNPTGTPQTLAIQFADLPLTGRGQSWRIADPDPMAYNEPGVPPRVRTVASPLTDFKTPLTLPPYSVTLYALEVAPK